MESISNKFVISFITDAYSNYSEYCFVVKHDSKESLFLELCERVEIAKVKCLENKDPYLQIQICDTRFPMFYGHQSRKSKTLIYPDGEFCVFNSSIEWYGVSHLETIIFTLEEWINDNTCNL